MTTVTGLALTWAYSGGVTDPGDVKYGTGWIAEIPTYQNFNFVLRNLDKAKLVLAESGRYVWQDNIEYKAGVEVLDENKTYICILDHNDLAGSNPQKPSDDSTHSYWTFGKSYSADANQYSSYHHSEGIKIHKIVNAVSSVDWLGSDITIEGGTALINLRTLSNSYDNLVFGNIRGRLVVANVGSTDTPDGRNLNDSSFDLYHEGNKPTQADISGTIPEAPQDGRAYARQNGNWVPVTTSVASENPPSAVAGSGHGWFNLSDGRSYSDINDGNSSQWVPDTPQMVPQATNNLGALLFTASEAGAISAPRVDPIFATTVISGGLMFTVTKSGLYQVSTLSHSAVGIRNLIIFESSPLPVPLLDNNLTDYTPTGANDSDRGTSITVDLVAGVEYSFYKYFATNAYKVSFSVTHLRP